MKIRLRFRSISNFGITLITLLVLIPTGTIAQDHYYYSGNEKHFFDKAEHWVSVMVPAGQRSFFLDQVTNKEEIRVRHTLDEERGIYWLEDPSGGDLRGILNQMNQTSENIRTFPVYYKIAHYVPGDTIWFVNTDEFRVSFEDHVTEEEIRELNELYNVEVARISRYGRYTLRITENSTYNTLETANRYHKHPITRWALPSHRTKWWPESIQDPYFSDQWYLQNTGQNGAVSGVDINAVEAWEETTGSSDIIVAVIDDGVEDHEDFYSGQVITGFTAGIPSGSGEPEFSYHAHGQLVAGIIAANHNSTGVRGVAPGVKIMPVNILHNPGITDPEDMAAVIDLAWENGADVLNNSWGGPHDNEIEDAIRRALINGRDGKGAIVVKSAGNDGVVTFPGTVDGVFVVGAVTGNNQKMQGSPESSLIDLVAPSGRYHPKEISGDLLVATTNRMGTNGYQDGIDNHVVSQNGNYVFSFGNTSAAAPQAAAVAALMLSINPDLEARSIGSNPNPEVQNILRNTATSYGTTNWAGHGRLNAADAVNYTAILAGGEGKLGHSGMFHFRESFTVPSGAKLTILAGTDVTFEDFTSLTIESGAEFIVEEGVTFTMWGLGTEIFANGRVTMLGSPNNEIEFDKPGIIGDKWEGIVLKGSGTSGSKIEHTKIQGAWTGLTLDNTFGVTIDAIETSENDIGFIIENVGIMDVTNSVFSNNRYEGAIVAASNVIWFGFDTQTGNDFRNNETGLVGWHNNRLYFGDDEIPANGQIRGNDVGIRVVNTELRLGLDDDGDVWGGGIWIDQGGSFDIEAEDAHIDAQYNYWGDFDRDPRFDDLGGNTFTYLPKLSDPNEPFFSPSSGKIALVSGITNEAASARDERGEFFKLLDEISVMRTGADRRQSIDYLSVVIEEVEPKLAQKAGILRLEDKLFLGNYEEVIRDAASLLEQSLLNNDEIYVNYLLMKAHLSSSGNADEVRHVFNRIVKLEPPQHVHRLLDRQLKRHGKQMKPIERVENNLIGDTEAVTLKLSNYPNPFNPVTNISYTLPEPSDVKLEIFNINGQRVALLTDGRMSSGTHQVAFDGSNLSSGIYFYRLQAGSLIITEKMILLK